MYEAGLTDSSQRDNVLHICLAGMMVDLMNGASHPVNGADMIEMETVAGLMDMISQEAASSVTFLHEAIEALRKADEYVEGISDTVMKLVVSVDKNSTEAIVVAGRQVDATIRAYVSISELSDPDRFFGYSI